MLVDYEHSIKLLDSLSVYVLIVLRYNVILLDLNV